MHHDMHVHTHIHCGMGPDPCPPEPCPHPPCPPCPPCPTPDEIKRMSPEELTKKTEELHSYLGDVTRIVSGSPTQPITAIDPSMWLQLGLILLEILRRYLEELKNR